MSFVPRESGANTVPCLMSVNILSSTTKPSEKDAA
jgi:hypothetical protein